MGVPPETWTSGCTEALGSDGFSRSFICVAEHDHLTEAQRRHKESLPLSQLQIKTPKRENLDCPSLCLMSPSFALECHDKQYQLGCLPLGVVFVMGRFEGHPWWREMDVCWQRSAVSTTSAVWSDLVIQKSRQTGIKYTFHSHGLIRIWLILQTGLFLRGNAINSGTTYINWIITELGYMVITLEWKNCRSHILR